MLSVLPESAESAIQSAVDAEWTKFIEKLSPQFVQGKKMALWYSWLEATALTVMQRVGREVEENSGGHEVELRDLRKHLCVASLQKNRTSVEELCVQNPAGKVADVKEAMDLEWKLFDTLVDVEMMGLSEEQLFVGWMGGSG